MLTVPQLLQPKPAQKPVQRTLWLIFPADYLPEKREAKTSGEALSRHIRMRFELLADQILKVGGQDSVGGNVLCLYAPQLPVEGGIVLPDCLAAHVFGERLGCVVLNRVILKTRREARVGTHTGTVIALRHEVVLCLGALALPAPLEGPPLHKSDVWFTERFRYGKPPAGVLPREVLRRLILSFGADAQVRSFSFADAVTAAVAAATPVENHRSHWRRAHGRAP